MLLNRVPVPVLFRYLMERHRLHKGCQWSKAEYNLGQINIIWTSTSQKLQIFRWNFIFSDPVSIPNGFVQWNSSFCYLIHIVYLNDVFVGVLNFASWGNRKKNWNVIHPESINEKSIIVVCIALFISTFLYFIHFLFSNIKKSSQRMSDYSIKIKGWENFSDYWWDRKTI